MTKEQALQILSKPLSSMTADEKRQLAKAIQVAGQIKAPVL